MTSVFDEFFAVLAFTAVLLVSPWLFPPLLGWALEKTHRAWRASQVQRKRLNAWWEVVTTPTSESGHGLRTPDQAVTRPVRSASASNRRYEVCLGDVTLRLVAHKVLGDWRRWRELLVMNEDTISDPELLVPGTTLIIPVR